jgi:uncharacterized protein YndB with AHSA1/START domain
MMPAKSDPEQPPDQADVLIPTAEVGSDSKSHAIANFVGETLHEIRIGAPPTTVWVLLTDARLIMRWLAPDVKTDPRPEGIFRITDFSGHWIEGVFLEVDSPRTVVFTWGGIDGLKPGQSTIEVRLRPNDHGTSVRLRHFRLSEAAVKMHCLVWKKWGLPKLKAVAEGREPGVTCLSEIADWREHHPYSRPGFWRTED